jgi:hypothetical protein
LVSLRAGGQITMFIGTIHAESVRLGVVPPMTAYSLA